MFVRAFGRTFFSPDSDGGSAAGDGTQQGDGGQQRQSQGGGDVLAGLQRLIERQSGDAGRVAELLYRENYDLRERARQLQGQLPAEGAVVLSGDQVQHWQTYQQLGAPDALTQRLTAAEQAQQELSGLRRAEQVRAAAEAAGYAPAVLNRLADGLTLDLRDQTVDGQVRRTPYVVSGEGAQQTATPLTDYARQHWAEFLPALQPAQQQGQGGGTTFVPQTSGNGAPANPVEAFIQKSNEARASKANPLKRD